MSAIHLRTERDNPPGWRQNENSRGEGFILLNNGHIIVLKEKDPGLFIEFGPLNSVAEGLLPELIVQNEDRFPVSVSNGDLDYYPLKIWQMSDTATAMMKDFSELTVSPEGRVYILSQESNIVGLLEGRLKVDEEKATMRKYYKIPSSIDYPEGMSFNRDSVLYIGSDQKNLNSNNIYPVSYTHLTLPTKA